LPEVVELYMLLVYQYFRCIDQVVQCMSTIDEQYVTFVFRAYSQVVISSNYQMVQTNDCHNACLDSNRFNKY